MFHVLIFNFIINPNLKNYIFYFTYTYVIFFRFNINKYILLTVTACQSISDFTFVIKLKASKFYYNSIINLQSNFWVKTAKFRLLQSNVENSSDENSSSGFGLFCCMSESSRNPSRRYCGVPEKCRRIFFIGGRCKLTVS